MIVTTVVLTNAAQANCFHSQCRSRMYAVTHQILNLNCVLSQMAINGTCEATPTRPQNSYPISARGLEGFNSDSVGQCRHFPQETSKSSPHRVRLLAVGQTALCADNVYYALGFQLLGHTPRTIFNTHRGAELVWNAEDLVIVKVIVRYNMRVQQGEACSRNF